MRILVKLALALALVAGVGVLFVRSVRETRAEPYTAARTQLHGWTVSVASASAPTDPVLVVRATPGLQSALFRQVFSRMAESLTAPAAPVVPLILQEEFTRALAGRFTPEDLAERARQAGLEGTAFEPRCLAHKRDSAPGVTRQLYVVLFDAPAFGAFRESLAAGGGPDGGYDPDALSAVLVVGASDTGFNRWLPLRLTPEADCLAPIQLT